MYVVPLYPTFIWHFQAITELLKVFMFTSVYCFQNIIANVCVFVCAYAYIFQIIMLKSSFHSYNYIILINVSIC